MDTVDEDNHNFWWSVELEASGGGAEEALMTAADLSGSVGSELFEDSGAAGDSGATENGGVTLLRASYLSSRGISHWLAAIDALKKDFPVRVRGHSKIENRPWHTDHIDAFPPIAVGAGLLVSAPWHKEKAKKETRLPIYIYPSSAFGTGYHESTQIALTFVERFVRKGGTVLDVGTGSGILFIAGLMLGAEKAAARDIDPVAVAEARRNMELNGIPDTACDLRTGDLLNDVDTQSEIITSNILLEPNLIVAAGVRRLLTPSGTAIFSGMTTEERTAFLPALSKAGLSVVAELTVNGWWGCAAQ